jgi:hypothetical protein
MPIIDSWQHILEAKIVDGDGKEQKGKGKGKGKERENAEDNEEVSGLFLDLKEGTYFLGDERNGSKLFVRPCYPDLAEIVVSINDARESVILTGNPGIGKSYFLFFFMHYLRELDPDVTIVLQRAVEERWYMFSREGVLVAHYSEVNVIAKIQPYLQNRKTWYLVDTATPILVPAKTLLVTSPYPKRYKKFRNTHTDIRYMPVWTLEEILTCRNV